MFNSNRKWSTAIVLFVVLCAVAPIAARPRKKKTAAPNGTFSYYLLVLSYAPDFCAQGRGNLDPRECGTGREIGFVVHGLWPQSENARGPENCGGTRQVPAEIINLTLPYIPTESLIQHEWTTHGTCSGLTSSDYFSLVRRARDKVKIPDQLKQPHKQIQLKPVDFQAAFAAANPAFPQKAFRATCYSNKDLQEARICLNKDLAPRACSDSAGQCSATVIKIRPVQ